VNSLKARCQILVASKLFLA